MRLLVKRQTRLRLRHLGAVLAIAAAIGVILPLRDSAIPVPGSRDRVCVYDVNSISGLSAFGALVGRRVVDCSMVYTEAHTWDEWVDPWFLHQGPADANFKGWVNSSSPNDRRQLIISQPLVPYGLAGDWRAVGATGAYESYAVQLARNLVAAGLGDAIIRLSWEMNGTWFPDNIGSTPQDFQNWVRLWRDTVIAMRSVRGENFRFVWSINNVTRNIPFASYYPGDDVVDIIGDDIYDALSKPGQSRWQTAYNSPGGFGPLIAFARAHNKPLAIPEWGVGGTGDDSTFVHRIGSVVKNDKVAFQTYFYTRKWASELRDGPNSLAAYKAAFGNGGYAVGPDNGTAMLPVGG